MTLHEMLQVDAPFRQRPDGALFPAPPLPEAILSGSFNPLHQGHRTLALVAAQKLGLEVAFELSIVNVDKPELDASEVARRLGQFRGKGEIWITRAATFVEKARLFPGVVMVVGYDTAARLIDPKYYRDEPRLRDAAMTFLRDLGCSFLVAGRRDGGGRFLGRDDLPLTPQTEDLFESLTEAEFRVDLCSTDLRNSGGAAQG